MLALQVVPFGAASIVHPLLESMQCLRLLVPSQTFSPCGHAAAAVGVAEVVARVELVVLVEEVVARVELVVLVDELVVARVEELDARVEEVVARVEELDALVEEVVARVEVGAPP